MKFTAACIQISSQNDMQANMAKVTGFINEASTRGADLITLPENTPFMSANAAELFANTYISEEHPALNTIRDLAAKLGKWVLVGSMAVKVNHSEKLANRSFLIDNNGKTAAHYDKIHLYNASISGGETHNESNRFISGNKVALAQTPWGKLGMTICYDLRFPHLFRKLAQSGADFITVPSAFTKVTGEAHWHVLLRARAIENGCYIIAPAQTGSHPANRKTYGHSLIVNPWGEIISDGGIDEGVTIAEIDTAIVGQIRQQLPSLEHDVDFG
jgi:predicted amidohydrolase